MLPMAMINHLQLLEMTYLSLTTTRTINLANVFSLKMKRAKIMISLMIRISTRMMKTMTLTEKAQAMPVTPKSAQLSVHTSLKMTMRALPTAVIEPSPPSVAMLEDLSTKKTSEVLSSLPVTMRKDPKAKRASTV